jgi:hypothetical protein
MATIPSAFYRDGNRIPITNEGIITKRTITFAGGTTNDWGDDGGTLDGGAIYTVTGLVKAQVVGVVTTDLVGGATIEVGITGGTAIFCAQVTDTVLDSGEIYLGDTTPASSFIIGEENAAADNLPIYLLNGNDIILTTTTTNTTSGVIDFYCIWTPISDDGNVVATTT